MAARLEGLAEPGGICISGAIREAVPDRLPLDYEALGAKDAKGFDEAILAYTVSQKPGEALPNPISTATRDGEGKPKRRRLVATLLALVLISIGVVVWLQPWKSAIGRADPAKMAYALPDKPSIAVLAFDNMSTDKEQDYFADGITEDIITDLSKVPGLFVIARNSSFAYKGKSVDVPGVARELGVRYVLEGSVRRAGQQLRVNAQLVEPQI